ncbi:MAG: peptidylprolyl isomerase [Bacteroidales bacterium]|nr:peptidylprolyl isomerase [Bacteroidales bacterium]
MNYKKYLLLFALFFVVLAVYCQDEKDNTDYLITINTDYGKIKLILFDDTPLHKQNFLDLATAGVYDHIIFHRIINNFMIQTGDYTTRNQPVDYNPKIIKDPVTAEILPHYLHVHGAIGAARSGDDINPERKSNSTQFYIIQNNKGAHHLDGQYTVFGQVMSGYEVLDAIAAQPTSKRDRPLKNIRITVDVIEVSKADIEKFYNFTYK